MCEWGATEEESSETALWLRQLAVNETQAVYSTSVCQLVELPISMKKDGKMKR